MLSIPRGLYDELVDRAERGGDQEVCGVLGGRFETDRSVVESIRPAENAAETPANRYRIAPEEQLELLDAIEDDGEEIIGFYHSHPNGPPRPSETDVREATWPDRSYVIVALDGAPFVGAWRWRGERFDPEAVVLDESGA